MLIDLLQQGPVLLAGHAVAAEGVATSKVALSLLKIHLSEEWTIVNRNHLIRTMRLCGCQHQLFANIVTRHTGPTLVIEVGAGAIQASAQVNHLAALEAMLVCD